MVLIGRSQALRERQRCFTHSSIGRTLHVTKCRCTLDRASRDITNTRAHRQVIAVEFGEIEPARVERVVAGGRRAAQPSAQHSDHHEMLTHVAAGIVIERIQRGKGVERFDVDGGFFRDLAHDRVRKRFPASILPPGKPQRPASGGLARRTSSTSRSRRTMPITAGTGRTEAGTLVGERGESDMGRYVRVRSSVWGGRRRFIARRRCAARSRGSRRPCRPCHVRPARSRRTAHGTCRAVAKRCRCRARIRRRGAHSSAHR